MIKFAKVRDVKSPNRGTLESAGLDFFVPKDFNPRLLVPGEDVMIPSGIKVKIEPGKALIAFNKSGVATKKHLQIGACVVDSDYQGEVHLHLTNIGIDTSLVKPGDKIAQFILMDVGIDIPEEVEEKDLYSYETERGTGMCGSTGEK